MQMILAVIALIASVLGLLFGILSRRKARPAGVSMPVTPALVILWAALAALLLFLLALPSASPFAPGMQLGWGIFIGMALGSIAVARSTEREEDGLAHAVELLALAAFGPALILLVFRGYPTVLLMGLAIGAVLTAFGAGTLLRPLFVARGTDDSGSDTQGPEVFALATTIIVAGTRLAIGHFPRHIPFDVLANRLAPFSHLEVNGGYWAVPALAVATAALVMAIIPRDVSERAKRWMPLSLGLAGGLTVTILAYVLGTKLLTELSWQPALLGLVAFGLITFGFTRQGENGRPLALAFGATLFTIAVLIIAFRGELHGYGEALVLLAALPVIATTLLAHPRQPLACGLDAGALTVGILLVLFRVFQESMPKTWTLDFQQHYNLIAVLLGAAATFGLLAFTGRTVERLLAIPGRNPRALLFSRAGLLAFFTGVTPLALAALWGMQAVGAFLGGLIVGTSSWMLLAAWTVNRERAAILAAPPSMPFILAALVAAQIAPSLFGLELTNAVKLTIAVVITVLLMAWVVADSLLHGATPAAPETPAEIG